MCQHHYNVFYSFMSFTQNNSLHTAPFYFPSYFTNLNFQNSQCYFHQSSIFDISFDHFQFELTSFSIALSLLCTLLAP